jgi:hypothetical protein
LAPCSDGEAIENLFSQALHGGLFVVLGGGRESWLKSLGVRGHGPSWLLKRFESMGEDPTSATYVRMPG